MVQTKGAKARASARASAGADATTTQCTFPLLLPRVRGRWTLRLHMQTAPRRTLAVAVAVALLAALHGRQCRALSRGGAYLVALEAHGA